MVHVLTRKTGAALLRQAIAEHGPKLFSVSFDIARNALFSLLVSTTMAERVALEKWVWIRPNRPFLVNRITGHALRSCLVQKDGSIDQAEQKL